MVGRRVAGFFEDPTAVEDVDGGRGGNSSSEGADAEDKDEEVEDEDDDAEDEEKGYDGGRVGKGSSSRKRRRGAKAARRPKAAPMLAIFEGKVTGFLPPTQEEPDPLYHIRYYDNQLQPDPTTSIYNDLPAHTQQLNRYSGRRCHFFSLETGQTCESLPGSLLFTLLFLKPYLHLPSRASMCLYMAAYGWFSALFCSVTGGTMETSKTWTPTSWRGR